MALHADTRLAALLEGLVAAELEQMVATARSLDPGSDAEAWRISGGVAAFFGRGSLVNQAFGLGFSGRVTPDDAAELAAFYAERGERGVVSVCPLADGSLTESLGVAGFRADSFEHVLVLDLTGPDDGGRDAAAPSSAVDVREVSSEGERDAWAEIAAAAFSAPIAPMPAQREIARLALARPGARFWLAYVDGVAVATAELTVEQGVAWLAADATLPAFRRRGAQSSLQRERLRVAREAGCEIAVTEARPGSASQRNMERLGFRVAYTRVDLLGPALRAGERE